MDVRVALVPPLQVQVPPEHLALAQSAVWIAQAVESTTPVLMADERRTFAVRLPPPHR